MNRATENTFVTSLRIIVVEDNHELRDILVTGLHYFGHRLRGVSDGQTLDRALAESPADIIILDLGLPGEDGIAIARRLRKNYSYGVVMVTARGRTDERVLGRESGADLYFVKPVDIRELNAALVNLAHRLFKRTQPAWRFTSQTSMLQTPQGVTIHLTAQECLLMQKLLEVPGSNVPRREIFTVLNQPDDIYADKRLETLVSRLRGKVKSADITSELPVRARHNLGYAFLAEVRP
ncbi:MAG: response regulator transcription factor [Proteobacteria bacterium]|nr:response regulator transcription factor [Pseudomonadota bacterium]